MKSSEEAFNLIVNQEIGSQTQYEKVYQRPEWPGANSGVTVGIGYDLGQTGASTIKSDWEGVIDNQMLAVMLKCTGITGIAAKSKTQAVRNSILIPWDKAIKVHKEKVIPRWEQTLVRTLPNTDILNADQFGALLSLIYNRGPAFQKKRDPKDPLDKYREMRNIYKLMQDKNLAAIPHEFRAMKRIWEGRHLDGLLARREVEAKLFEK